MEYTIALVHEEDVNYRLTQGPFKEFSMEIPPCAGDILALGKNKFFVVKTRMMNPNNEGRIILFGKTVVKGIDFKQRPCLINVDVVIEKLEELHPTIVDPRKMNPFLYEGIRKWHDELKQLKLKNQKR